MGDGEPNIMPVTKLKLGKGSSFVKSRLRGLPQEDDVWEADFQPILNGENVEFWLGMAVSQDIGIELSHEVLTSPPTVNDLARLIADAIQRPIIEGTSHRPGTLILRDDPQWQELFPHLRELGIELEFAVTLPAWRRAAEEGGIEHAQTMMSLAPPRITEDRLLAAMFPTVAKWVRSGGWIEIGDQDGLGFVVRALDYGGLVFENDEARTLDEAMTALDAGITEYVKKHGMNLG